MKKIIFIVCTLLVMVSCGTLHITVYDYEIRYDIISGNDTLHIVHQDSLWGTEYYGIPIYMVMNGELIVKLSYADSERYKWEGKGHTLERCNNERNIEVHSFEYSEKRQYKADKWKGKEIKE